MRPGRDTWRMSSTVDHTRRPPPPPPPPPKPKPVPHAATHKASADHAAPTHHATAANAKATHAVAKKATAQVQHAARARFAHAAPTHAEAKTRTQQATHAINKAAKAISAAHDDDGKRKAVMQAARTLSQSLQHKTHAEKSQILDDTHHALGAIGAGLDKLTGDQTKRAVADLSSATETAGPSLARKITDPVARALPSELKGDGDNPGELVDGIKGAVSSGRGALFATSLAQSAKDVPGLTQDGSDKGLARVAGEAIDDAKKTFTDANKTATMLDARLAITVEQWQKGGALSPGAIQAGIDAYKADHKDDYAAADNAAHALAAALPGAGTAAREDGPLGDASRAALAQVPALAQRDSGARMLSDAIERDAPFLDESKRVLSHGPNAKAQLAGFDNAVLRSVALGGPDLVRHGERQRLSALVAGAARVVSDRKLGDALSQYRDKVDALPPDLTGVTLGRQLASTATTIAGATLGGDGASVTSAAPRFQALGAALGLGALAQDAVTFDPEDLKSVLGTAEHATSEGISIASLAGKSVGRAGLAVGVAFSTFDVGASLADGDVAGAAAASLPLVGAGVGMVVGGPVGAGIGLAAGGIAETAISLFGSGGDSPDVVQEKAVDPFLRGAFAHDHVPDPETAAYRLRDVYTDKDTFVGVGDSLGKLARATGQTPHQVLTRLARLPSDDLKSFTTAILDARKTDSRSDDHAVAALLAQLENKTARAAA